MAMSKESSRSNPSRGIISRLRMYLLKIVWASKNQRQLHLLKNNLKMPFLTNKSWNATILQVNRFGLLSLSKMSHLLMTNRPHKVTLWIKKKKRTNLEPQGRALLKRGSRGLKKRLNKHWLKKSAMSQSAREISSTTSQEFSKPWTKTASYTSPKRIISFRWLN